MADISAEEIFEEFREHSIAEFFKKNRQMLGYSGMVRSLVTVVHEYVTNSLDATEEAGILPDIYVAVTQIADSRYKVHVMDNGPGIPRNFIGKALATILAGTKFHRYVQLRGQQGIGAAGCTLFAQITTGKPILVKSGTGKGKAYTCHVAINTAGNKPLITGIAEVDENFRGLSVEGEFAEVKYEKSEHGIYEYLKRTALSNPHAQIKFKDPTGEEFVFLRSVDRMPPTPKPVKAHPLGLGVNDLLEFAHVSQSRKISSFLVDTFTRVTSNKVAELKEIAKSVDFDREPKQLQWHEAEELIKAIRQVKWIAPDASAIIPIGEAQVKVTLKNILNPEFMSVVERKPKVFRGGIPFIIEAAVAWGGNSGYKTESGYTGSILRYANRVPLLFDAGNCAITEAAKEIQWKRYNIDFENQAVSVFVNLSSVHIPYAGVGKEAISKEPEIIEEIKLAIMDAARGVQNYVRGKQTVNFETGRYKSTMRYAKQLAQDLSYLSGAEQKEIEKDLEKLVAKHYPHIKNAKVAEETSGESGSPAEGAEE